MDETPIKAGRKSPGKLNQGYYWALYGDKDEVSFPYSHTRAFGVVRVILGSFCGVLLADGYGAYDRYAQEEKDVVLAQCWAHTRRNFVEAEGAERKACGQTLDFIGELYRHEDSIRRKGLSGEAKLVYRAEYSKPVVEAFFAWLAKKFAEWSILASSPFAKAASYALERQSGLSVFLSNPNVAIDTNHLERGLREFLRWTALSRIYLDSIPNHQASWPSCGPDIAEVGLHMGCNDFGSTMLEENVVSQAGGHTAKQPMMTPEDLVFHIRRAGYTAAQRDSSFNILKIFE